MQIIRRPASLLPLTFPSTFLSSSFEREMEDLVRRFLGAPVTAGDKWTPAGRVEEDDGNVMVTVELPGVEAKDVSLSIEGRDLVVSGERKTPPREKNVTCHFDEILGGPFFLRIGLPADVVADKTSADYKVGLLHITLPKAATAKRARIPINVTKS